MIAWLFTAALAGAPCPRAEADQAAFTASLEAMHDAARDELRRLSAGEAIKDGGKARVKAILKHDKKGALCAPDDRFWAAMVLLLSTDRAAVERAYNLSKELLAERHPRGAWLTGMAYDRWNIAYGRMQAYGTQTVPSGSKLCLLWVDPTFTDEQRQKYGHGTLADAAQRVLEANGAKGAPATVAELKKRELWCKPEPWDGSRSDLQDPYGR